MKLLLLFFFLPAFVFAMDEFEKDLANLKQKYKGTYQKEELQKWDQVVEKEAKPTFSENLHEHFRHLDLNVFFNYYFFNNQFDPDGNIAGQLSSAGPDLDLLYKLWKPFDLYVYGNYGFTGEATFVETTNVYSVPNNFLAGIGAYFFNEFPRVSPYVSLEFQQQSFVGVNDNIDYSTVNVLTQLQAQQITSINLALGMDVPFRMMDKNGLIKAYLAPSLIAQSTLADNSFEENVAQLQYGIKMKYIFYEPYSLDLGYRGGFNQGVTLETYNTFFLNLGFRF
jgi:hypothetical protein